MSCPYLVESNGQFSCKVNGKPCNVVNYPACSVFKSHFFGGAHRPVRVFKND